MMACQAKTHIVSLILTYRTRQGYSYVTGGHMEAWATENGTWTATEMGRQESGIGTGKNQSHHYHHCRSGRTSPSGPHSQSPAKQQKILNKNLHCHSKPRHSDSCKYNKPLKQFPVHFTVFKDTLSYLFPRQNVEDASTLCRENNMFDTSLHCCCSLKLKVLQIERQSHLVQYA